MRSGEIKERILKRWPTGPIADICTRIIDKLDNLPTERRRMLTFDVLAKAASLKGVDSDLLAALNVLCHTSPPALERRATFFDDDSREHDLSPTELADALTGGFVHPITGQVVQDASQRIVVYFCTPDAFEGRVG